MQKNNYKKNPVINLFYKRNNKENVAMGYYYMHGSLVINSELHRSWLTVGGPYAAAAEKATSLGASCSVPENRHQLANDRWDGESWVGLLAHPRNPLVGDAVG